MFGIAKDGGAGSSLRFLNLTYLKRVMPKKCYEDFREYYKKNKNKRKRNLKYLMRSIRYSLYILKVILQQKKIIQSFKDTERKYNCSTWAPSFLFFCVVEIVRKRYKICKKLIKYNIYNINKN